MFIMDCLDINSKGHLTIGSVDTTELAMKYGTPLYVMDEDTIRRNCRMYKDAIDKHYDGNGLILYASKAFCTKRMCRIANEEGLGIDVVSGGELYTALSVDFPMEKIYFHGNNKTKDELIMAVMNDVGRIVVDNIEELELLNSVALEYGKKVKILFRIKPGIDAHTHDFVRTGQIDSKFGVALENGEAFSIIEHAVRLRGIEVVGVHCHIGSQIFEIAPFELAAEVMLSFIAKVRNELNVELRELNLGGGFGIKYLPRHNPVEYDKYMEKISELVKKICKNKGLTLPKILMEPGRSIVGPAGITLYTVGSVKEIKNIRTYVAVDGGMGDNPRYALYKAPYDAVVANRANTERTKLVTIAGRNCESGDLLQEDIMIAPCKKGDIIAMLATGAYNYSMASNYNRVPRAPVIMIKDGEATVAVKRETYEDLLINDCE